MRVSILEGHKLALIPEDHRDVVLEGYKEVSVLVVHKIDQGADLLAGKSVVQEV